MSGDSKRQRGRPSAPNPRGYKVEFYLTDAEWAELEASRLSEDRSGFARRMYFTGLRSDFTRYQIYHDSGQAAIDDAESDAEEMAELYRQNEAAAERDRLKQQP